MMKWRILSSRLWRLWIPGASLLLLGGCGLSDAQLTAIFQSAVSTALNALVLGLLSSLLPQASAAA